MKNSALLKLEKNCCYNIRLCLDTLDDNKILYNVSIEFDGEGLMMEVDFSTLQEATKYFEQLKKTMGILSQIY